ncbi:MAG: hypothetical protein ACP5UC_01625 [Candidatus Micrarchaeia archaeon]
MPKELQGSGEKYNRLYLLIIERYKEYIEEKERLSVAELPRLVTPYSPGVAKKAEEIKESFPSYSYNLNFYEASVKAFEFVKSSIEEVVLPLQFWLTPEETLEFEMGDEIDKNILLCSILVALGNPSAKVLMHIKDSVRKTIVYLEFEGKVYVLDFEEGISVFGGYKEMLGHLNIGEESTAYEFNDRTYRDIA